MALITCTHCGKQMSDRADVCPHCGKITEKNQIVYKERKDLRLSIISCICFIISYGFAYEFAKGNLYYLFIMRWFEVRHITYTSLFWHFIGYMFYIVPLALVVLGIVFHCKNKSKENISGIGFGLFLLLIAYPTCRGLCESYPALTYHENSTIYWTWGILTIHILPLLLAAVAHYLICKHKSVKFKLIAGLVILIFILTKIFHYLF